VATTLLAHLTDKLISQRENAATEAIAFVLNRSEAARRALARHVAPAAGEVSPILRVETQHVAGDESRPDIVLLGEGAKVLGYIEAKFWAALTAAQPVDYLRRLAEGGGGVLVMLAPERRLSTLRAELVERCRGAALAVEERGAMGFTVGLNRLVLVSWAGLLAALADAVADDPAALSDLRQLRGLTERFESEGFIPFTRADFDDLDLPRRVLVLANLVNDIIAKAAADGVVDLRRLKPSHAWHCAGRYIALPRAGAWFGLNHALWLERGQSPLWVRFVAGDFGRGREAAAALKAWTTAVPPRAFADADGTVRLPVLLRTGVEKSAVIEGVVAFFREVDAAMKAGGMPLTKGEPPADGADE